MGKTPSFRNQHSSHELTVHNLENKIMIKITIQMKNYNVFQMYWKFSEQYWRIYIFLRRMIAVHLIRNNNSNLQFKGCTSDNIKPDIISFRNCYVFRDCNLLKGQHYIYGHCFSIVHKYFIGYKQMIRKAFARSFSVSMPAFDYKPAPYTGIPYEQVLHDRKHHVPQFNLHYYKEPLLIVEGKMQYLFDHKGNRYQDWISGISTVSIGHSHPALVKAITDQSKKLVHISQINFSNVQAEYAKMLCEQLGEGFDTVYLANSGGEANDFAINLARTYTRNMNFLSLRNGYHGLVGAAASVTNMPTWSNGVALRGPAHEKLTWPSKYRSAHQTVQGLKQDALEIINSNCNGKIAGMIFEPIQGIGGINTFVDGYLPMITDLVKSHKGLIISDEVQTGFGRVGTKFWGFRYYNYKPDIVTMAKGIANGLPLAAVVTRKQIASAMNFNFFNTTGGGNIQCRAGIEVIKAIKNDKLAENSQNVGGYLLTELQRIAKNSKVVGDARGAGLMIGIEIVTDRDSKTPSKDICNEIMEKLRERWILLGRGGAYGNVLRLQPSLCMQMDDAKYFIHHFEDIVNSHK